jgi:ABC-type multidrug transport system fused ATPase/permease subunit
MIIMAALVTNWMAAAQKQSKAYAMSSGYSSQALEGIKVVHTYGQEGLELKNYRKYLEVVFDVK